MLGDSKDDATINAETIALVPKLTLSNMTSDCQTSSENVVKYSSIHACWRKTFNLMVELKATKRAKVDIDTGLMRIAEDVQLTTGGGGKIPKR